PADRAAAHFAALRSRYHVIGLSDFLAARSNRTTDRLPPRALIITFDDGHKSNYDLRPLLEAHRIPVTIFLCGGIVGTQRHYWWLHARNAANAQRLKALPDEQRTRELLHEGHTDTREYNTRHALSRGEIEEMKGMVDFQSHTMFHPILPACSDERAEQEIVGSKQVLESQFGLRLGMAMKRSKQVTAAPSQSLSARPHPENEMRGNAFSLPSKPQTAAEQA